MIAQILEEIWQRLPVPLARIATQVISLATGLLIALILHYLLYRISLPGTPFIYVVF